jgi:alkylation response protein AidB-like acyl-CoA dehydrogenase
MELEFSADQDELRDSMRAVLGRESPVALARRVVDDDVRPDALWATLTGLGWTSLTVPEADGGIGLGIIEAGILAEEIGRVIAPGPLLATVTQFVPAVREIGTAEQRARFLGAVAAGGSGTLAIAETGGSFDPATVAATVVFDGTTAVLAGEKRFVVEGDAIDEMVVVAREPGTTGDDGVHAIVVPVAATRTRRVNALDGSLRSAHVDLDGVRIDRDRVLGTASGSSAAGLRRAIEEATVATALEIVGISQTIFDVTLEYAKQREQFGVPIGSFQAIKHKFADMIVLLERARATGYFAALTIAEDDPRRTTATSRPATASASSPRRASRSTAASATRGSTTCTST